MNTKTSDRRKKKPCMWNLDFTPYNSPLIRIKYEQFSLEKNIFLKICFLFSQDVFIDIYQFMVLILILIQK